jgi:hypothetical protein
VAGVGSLLFGHPGSEETTLVLGLLAFALVLREIGILRFPITVVRRQTSKSWLDRFGPTTGALMWGLDLGSGLLTIVVFSGYWLMLTAVVLSGSIGYGALVFGMYTLGRLTAILTPLRAVSHAPYLVSAVEPLLGDRPTLSRAHAITLGVLAVGLLARGLTPYT